MTATEAARSEALVVARAKAGDAIALTDIVRRYQPRLRAFCFRRLGNSADAEDVTQETFLRALAALSQTGDDLALNAWLHRIAANACTDLLRQRQRARWLPWEGNQHDRPSVHREDDPEAALLDAEARRLFEGAVQGLSPRNRGALLLRCRDDCSLREIGARLDLSEAAVKSLLFRARAEIRSRAPNLAERR